MAVSWEEKVVTHNSKSDLTSVHARRPDIANEFCCFALNLLKNRKKIADIPST